MARQQVFYQSAVPLSADRHHEWSIEAGTDCSFARHATSVPLTAAEFSRAALEYVIVFAGDDQAVMPLAILGLRENENVYVTQSKKWEASYVPAFVRRYPFILSSGDDGRSFALCIDETFAGFNSENRGERLFDEAGKPSQFVDNVLTFLRQYQLQFRATAGFCSKLVKLNLLHPVRFDVRLNLGARVALTGFMAVDRDRLNKLAPEALAELVKSDQMELVYLHLWSMRNLSELKSRAAALATPSVADRSSPRRHSARTALMGGGGARYNTEFIFGECGFDWIPPWIDRKLLFNASYDLGTGEIKLYFVNAARDTIFKAGGGKITKQYDALRFGTTPSRLSDFLAVDLDFSDVLIDTVEDDVYYVLLEDSSLPQYLKFLRAVCAKFGVSESRLIEVINKINKHQVKDLREAYGCRAVSGLKVPFVEDNCKVYARPFLTGNSYDLNRDALQFLMRFHDCSEKDLQSQIRYLWVGSELLSERVVITTQHHALVHGS